MQEHEQRLDELFSKAFGVNEPPMVDYALIKMELKQLRSALAEKEKENADLQSQLKEWSLSQTAKTIAEKEEHIKRLEAKENWLSGLSDENMRLLTKLVEKEKECEGLRELLFWQHYASGHRIYGDDGEWQCLSCMIDFRRDIVERIKEQTERKAKQALAEGEGLCQSM